MINKSLVCGQKHGAVGLTSTLRYFLIMKGSRHSQLSSGIVQLHAESGQYVSLER